MFRNHRRHDLPYHNQHALPHAYIVRGSRAHRRGFGAAVDRHYLALEVRGARSSTGGFPRARESVADLNADIELLPSHVCARLPDGGVSEDGGDDCSVG